MAKEDSNILTDEQVAAWRKALSLNPAIGQYANIMPVEDIQKMRDDLQNRVLDVFK